jgi:hypothetical protein
MNYYVQPIEIRVYKIQAPRQGLYYLFHKQASQGHNGSLAYYAPIQRGLMENYRNTTMMMKH